MSQMRSFNIDFNWLNGTYSPKDTFASADAACLADWYEKLGCNNFWTFAVSYNGRAWYDSKFSPKIEGLQGNFTKDCVTEGHKRGMTVFAYHCLAKNPVVEAAHPEWARKNPQDLFSMILCDDYLDWFCAAIRESITVCGLDGLVIDWFRCPGHRLPDWEPVEKELYVQLMQEPFPETPSPAQIAAFEKKSIEHAWKRIKAAVAEVGNVPIWTNHPFDFPEDPVWNGNLLLKEADYILNESPDYTLLDWLKREAGPHTSIVQNICGWQNHDVSAFPEDILKTVDLFGFAAADPSTCLPFTAQPDPDGSFPDDRYTPVQKANQKNIDNICRIFRERKAAETT